MDLEKIAEQKVKENKTKNTENKDIYCHFSCLSPKNEEYGIFSCIMTRDKFGYGHRNPVARKVMAYKLWEKQQYVTYCQTFWFALKCVYEWQGKMMNVGVNTVFMVCDNSVLTQWISDIDKCNKGYRPYMNRAVRDFKTGGSQEIMINVGLLKPVSIIGQKYCKREFIDNPEEIMRIQGKIKKGAVYTLNMDTSQMSTVKATNIEGLDSIRELV